MNEGSRNLDPSVMVVINKKETKMNEKEEQTTSKVTAVEMSGKVLWFNSQSGKGRILGSDGLEYFVAAHNVTGEVHLPKWALVKFRAVSTSRGQRAEKVELQVTVANFSQSKEHESSKRFVPALQTPEGLAKLKLIETTYAESQKEFAKSMSYLGIALIVIGLLPKLPIGIALLGAVIWLFSLSVSTKKRMSEATYYTIPHSKDKTGKHRCISCGAHGIYRHTPYKTTTALADCSKCGFELWSA